MKIRVNRNDLHKALAFVAKHADKGLTIPVLGCVLLTASGGKLSVMATNLEAWATAPCAADIEAEGGALVRADTLAPLVAKMKADAAISLHTEGNHLVALSGKSRSRIEMMPVQDFASAALPRIEDRSTFTMDAKRMAEMLGAVLPAADDGTKAFYLAGVSLSFNDKGELRAAASDGNRAAMVYQEFATGALERDTQTIIAIRSAEGIFALCKSAPGSVTVSIAQAMFSVVMESGETLLTKVIDGTFPDIERLRPYGQKLRATIDRESLSDALGSALVFSDNALRKSVKLNLSEGGSFIESMAEGRGDGRFPVDCEYEGKDFVIGVNARFLADAIGSMDNETLVFGFRDAGSPISIQTAVGARDIGIIMPVRI